MVVTKRQAEQRSTDSMIVGNLGGRIYIRSDRDCTHVLGNGWL